MDVGMIAGLGGGIVSAFGALDQRKKMKEIYRQSLIQAEGGMLKNRDQVENINPQASANAAMAQVSDAQTQAMAQAGNVGAGQAAAAGLGGDVTAGNVASLKAAQPLGTVAAQFGAQKAQIQANTTGEQLQKGQVLGSLNTQLADSARNQTNLFQDKPGVMDFLKGALGGINAGTNAYELLQGKKIKNDKTVNEEQA